MDHNSERLGTGVARLTWAVLVTYVLATLVLVNLYNPKVVLDRDGPAALERLPASVPGRLYALLTPLWLRNRVVVPSLAAVALLATSVARTRRRRGRTAAVRGA
jgi:hypothetical protein